jgi:hypothetical protein
MKFCFFKRLASALEETMSVAQLHLGKPESLLIGASRKQSAVVVGRVLNFGTRALFLSDMKFCFMKQLFSHPR